MITENDEFLYKLKKLKQEAIENQKLYFKSSKIYLKWIFGSEKFKNYIYINEININKNTWNIFSNLKANQVYFPKEIDELSRLEKKKYLLKKKEIAIRSYQEKYNDYKENWKIFNQICCSNEIKTKTIIKEYLINLLIYYEMTTAKLASINESSAQKQIQEHFMKKFKTESSLQNNNNLNGHLVDFEFFVMKKNYTQQIYKNLNKKNINKSIFSSFIFNQNSEKLFKTESMDGMVSSTIFTINNNDFQESEQSTKKTSFLEFKNFSNEKLSNLKKIPFLFDFLILYAER